MESAVLLAPELRKVGYKLCGQLSEGGIFHCQFNNGMHVETEIQSLILFQQGIHYILVAALDFVCR